MGFFWHPLDVFLSALSSTHFFLILFAFFFFPSIRVPSTVHVGDGRLDHILHDPLLITTPLSQPGIYLPKLTNHTHLQLIY